MQGDGGGEIVSVHVGQAGVRWGAVLWELLCREHGLNSNGSLALREPVEPVDRDDEHDDHLDEQVDQQAKDDDGDDHVLESTACFRMKPKGGAEPRALLVDTDDAIIDEVRTGIYRHMFPPASLVTGGDGDDAACCFARGYNAIGQRNFDAITQRLRCLLDDCDNLQTVLLYHSSGGGTGSGLTARLAEHLRDELGKKVTVAQLAVNFTPQIDGAVVEPYNAALSALAMSTLTDAALLFDNSAALAVCQRHLDVESPCVANANRVMAQMAAAVTAAGRRRDAGATSLPHVVKHLVKQPQLKYLVGSLSPLRTNRGRSQQVDVPAISRQAFRADHHLAEFDPRLGRYLACTLLYRGDVVVRDIVPALREVRSLGRFEDQCPDFQVSLCSQPPAMLPFSELGVTHRACALLSNTTAVAAHWAGLRTRFSKMWQRRAFAHWFHIEGVETDAFDAAEDYLATLEEAYEVAWKEP